MIPKWLDLQLNTHATRAHTTKHPICLILNSSKNKNKNSRMYEPNKSVYIHWGWGGCMEPPNVKKNVHEWHFSVFPLIAFAFTEPRSHNQMKAKETAAANEQTSGVRPFRRKIQNEISNYAPRSQSIRKSIKGCSILLTRSKHLLGFFLNFRCHCKYLFCVS